MKLQEITVTPSDYNEMYFRGGNILNNSLFLNAGKKVSFDTYFNCFSYTKYSKYTSVKQVTFSCYVEGDAKVSLCIFDGASETVLCTDATKDGHVSFCIDITSLPTRAILYPVIYAISDTKFISGAYHCNHVEPENINCAIAICTYKREESTLNNLKTLTKADFSFVNKVFVIDNGQTLSQSEYSNDFISIVPNKNLGGSGGFTRGIIESHKNGFSHVILMDDDIVIFPEAIERLTVFISLLLPKYKDAHFCTAMLPISKPYIQYEMGAHWNGHRVESFKPNVNLLNPSELVNNLDEDNIGYGAWWCFCLPLSDVDKFGLPLPLFIKFDDVEYGIRCCKNAPIIAMSGVCVAHEDFDKKYNMVLNYYSLRNQLIMLACHKKQTRFGCISRLWKITALQTFLYRYDTMELQLIAFVNFLQGTDFLINTDEESFNKHLMSITPKPISLHTIPEWNPSVRAEYSPKKQGIISKIIQILTLGGHLIPSFFLKKKAFAFPLPETSVGSCYLKKTTIQYQLDSDTGFVYKRSVKRFFKCIFKSIKMSFKILFTYGKAKKSYLKNKEYLASKEFWYKHLELDKS